VIIIEQICIRRSEVVYNVHKGLSFERLIPLPQSDNEEIHDTTLSFHNINYELNVNTNIWSKLPFCKSKEKKLILSNVSATFKPGMNAILGKYNLFNIQHKTSR
jgi:hypothetical protein